MKAKLTMKSLDSVDVFFNEVYAWNFEASESYSPTSTLLCIITIVTCM